MNDRILLSGMRFEGRHGVLPEEREASRPFEVDVELVLDLRAAGSSDDIDRTADYRAAFDICRGVIEGPGLRLIEALAEEIAARLLAAYRAAGVAEVVVRVRKPRPPLPGRVDWAGVEIRRSAAG